VTGNNFYRECLRSVAIHEAGHVTLYAAIKYPIKSVNVTCLAGRVRLIGEHPSNFRRIVGLLAGYAAQKVILGDTIKKRPGKKDSSDIKSAEYIAINTLGYSHWREVMRAGRLAAERFARANRMQIEAVAEMLHQLDEGGGCDVDGSRIMARLKQLPPLTAIPPRDYRGTKMRKTNRNH